jgi:predicted lipoprotein
VIAREVLADWTAPDGVRAAIAANKGWKSPVRRWSPEAARLLLTDLVAGFKLMHDCEAACPVLGAAPTWQNPKSAEAWRSGRLAARISKLNVIAAQALGKAVRGKCYAGAPDQESSSFSRMRSKPSMRCRAISARRRRSKTPVRVSMRAAAAIKAVQTEIAATLPGDVGVTLGFNSLDGD